MRVVVVLISLLIFSGVLLAQTSNADRLAQIETELDRAVDNGNFEKAARLKEEREIRRDIESALEAGDFEKAASLKAQLEGNAGNNPEPTQRPPQTNQPTQGSGISVDDSPNQELRSEPAETAGEQSGRPNRITKSGFYLELLVGGGGYSHQLVRNFTGPAIAFNLGNKFYMGDKNRDIRFGLDMNWGSIGGIVNSGGFYGGGAVHLAFVNPGFTMGASFNDAIGIEANFYMGPSVMIYTDQIDSEVGGGLRFGPQVKFRYKVLAVGFEFRYTRAFNEVMDSRIGGIIIGVKF